MITIRESVEITDAERSRLTRDLSKIIEASKDDAEALKKLSERAREFVMGNHTGKQTAITNGTFSMAKHGGAMEDRESPLVDLFPGEFSRMAGYIIGKQSKPYVEAEDRVLFEPDGEDDAPLLPPEVEPEEGPVNPMLEIRKQLAPAFPIGDDGQPLTDDEGKPLVTDSELLEAVLTARLDRMMERIDWPRIQRMCLMRAELDRVCNVLIGYDQDEGRKEPVFIDLLPSGDYGWDDSADTFANGNYQWRNEPKVLAQDVANDYDIPLQDVIDHAPDGDAMRNKDLPDSLKTVKLVHVWRRNKEIVEVGGDPTTPARSAYKYRAGWQYCVMLGKRVIFNGHSTSPDGTPPMEAMGSMETPDSQFSLGMYDRMASSNRVADELMHVIVESARKSLKKIAVDPTKFANPQELTSGTVKGVLVTKDGIDPRTAIAEFDGGGANGEINAAFAFVVSTLRETLGTLGLNADDFGSDISGVAAEGVKQDRSGIVAVLHAPTADKFAERVLTRCLEFILEYEDTPTTLKIIGQDKEEHRIRLNVGKFAMKGTDIQPRFDVKVTRAKNGIDNPIKEAEHITTMMQSFFEILGSQGPDAAAMWLEAVELRIKPELRKFLKMVKAKAEAPAESESTPQSEAEIKAQAEIAKDQASSTFKVQVMAAASTADSIEREVTGHINAGQLDQAAQLRATIPTAIRDAYLQADPSAPQAPAMPAETQGAVEAPEDVPAELPPELAELPPQDPAAFDPLLDA